MTYKKYAPIYACQLVRQSRIENEPRAQFTDSAITARFAIRYFQELQSPAEIFVAFLVDTKNRLIGTHNVTTGVLDSSLVHPREAFRAAILANASAVIFAHNHPSGDVEPSRADHDVTKRLIACGDILGIQVLDHIVVTDWEAHSMRESAGKKYFILPDSRGTKNED